VDSPKALSLDLGIMEDIRSGCELRPDPSREWARCSISSWGRLGQSRKRAMSSVQADIRAHSQWLGWV